MSAVRQFNSGDDVRSHVGNALRIALAGNPNCGKTTVFNGYTGARQHVGNYPASLWTGRRVMSILTARP